jgi:hypothetical protein
MDLEERRDESAGSTTVDTAGKLPLATLHKDNVKLNCTHALVSPM